MLERVSVHQTRLRVPGLGLDARGIALGSHGLVLLPSLERLVAFLSLYTEEHTLESMKSSLRVEVVRSRLGLSEIALIFEAASSDHLDRVREMASLAGGFTFTGTNRHFVQYRDASAPFGYDAAQVTPTDAAWVLYHTSFSQVYESERTLDLRSLIIAVSPFPERHSAAPPGDSNWVLAEPGVGHAVMSYLVRSGVECATAVVEWRPETSFDDAPSRRWLFRVAELPRRMLELFTSTPGIAVFRPACPGAAVEVGFRHPVSLEACSVFDPAGLVLLRGRNRPPYEIERLPTLGDARALVRVKVAIDTAEPRASSGGRVAPIAVPLHVRSSEMRVGEVEAAFVSQRELPLLRRLAYALGKDVIDSTRLALVEQGAWLLRDGGIQELPLGLAYRRIHDVMYAPAGFELVPAVRPHILFQSLGSPSGVRIFFRPNRKNGHLARAVAVRESHFVTLGAALLEGQTWAPLEGDPMRAQLELETPVLELEPLGLRPLAGVVRDDEAESD